MNTDLQLPSMYDSLKDNIGDKANYVPLTPLSFLARSADVYPSKPCLVYGEPTSLGPSPRIIKRK